jgi:ABC-type sugar transport system ATPase subunit
MGAISLRGVRKRFGSAEVIAGIDLDVRDGEFLVFVGPSGCGKSTLLRMIAGLEDITAGDLLIDGLRANEIHPADRGAAMVFQSYALYPHMTVAENMGFALRMAGVPRAQRDAQVQRAADVLRIVELLGRYPKELSGGQRQRVAIGRAIVRQPRVFLFDEPLSNLDAALRVSMRIELSRLHRALGTTMIYVTHDQVEAMTLGERSTGAASSSSARRWRCTSSPPTSSSPASWARRASTSSSGPPKAPPGRTARCGTNWCRPTASARNGPARNASARNASAYVRSTCTSPPTARG